MRFKFYFEESFTRRKTRVGLEELVTEPKLRSLTGIDRELAKYVNLYLQDWGVTSSHTHKIKKMAFTVRYCVDKLHKQIMLFANFSKKILNETEGSGIDALRLISYYYPDTEVVEFYDPGKNSVPMVGIKPINPSVPDGPKKVRIEIDATKYVSPKRLETIFERLVTGKKPWFVFDRLSGFYKSQDAQELRDYFESRGISTIDNHVAVTNLEEFAPGNNAYACNGSVGRSMKDMDVNISIVGSGEFALNQVRSIKPGFWKRLFNGMPYHILVSTPNNNLNRDKKKKRSGFINRLDSPYSNPALKKLISYIKGDGNVFYKIVGRDDAIDGAGLANHLRTNYFPTLRIGDTGHLPLCMIVEGNYIVNPDDVEVNPHRYRVQLKDNKNYRSGKKRKGVLFPSLNRYGQEPLRTYSKDSRLFLPKKGFLKRLFSRNAKYNVCVVYTGASSDEFLKRKILNDANGIGGKKSPAGYAGVAM